MVSFQTLLQVALGGALGASARVILVSGMDAILGAREMPLGVPAANILGSFAIGAALAVMRQRGLGGWDPFLVAGFLGGFTTFSAFSKDAFEIFEKGAPGLAALYVSLSVAGSLAAIFAGFAVATWIAR